MERFPRAEDEEDRKPAVARRQERRLGLAPAVYRLDEDQIDPQRGEHLHLKSVLLQARRLRGAQIGPVAVLQGRDSARDQADAAVSRHAPRGAPRGLHRPPVRFAPGAALPGPSQGAPGRAKGRSEEHTSELQSRLHLVCRLLLEKKKKKDSVTIMLMSYIII